jgi:hypothetical protein
MSTTGSQGGGGGAAAAGGPPAVPKRPMSSQKSVRSGSTPGPLSGQKKKSTLGNGVSLPRKPSRSVYGFRCFSVFITVLSCGRASVSF